MDEGSSKTHVGSDQVSDICRSKVWRSNSVQQSLIDLHFRVEDKSLVVLCIVRAVTLAGEQNLSQKREAVVALASEYRLQSITTHSCARQRLP